MLFDVSYCEVPIADALFQPFNTVSNLFYLMAAVMLFFYFRKSKIRDMKSMALVFLLTLTGLGSFAWHFYDTELTSYMDTIPIIVFAVIYSYFLLAKLLSKKIGFYLTAAYAAFALTASTAFEKYAWNLNGASAYLMLLLFLAVALAYAMFKGKSSKWLVAAFILFLFGLIFRQADILLCPYAPMGTHFLWHILVAAASYCAARALYKR